MTAINFNLYLAFIITFVIFVLSSVKLNSLTKQLKQLTNRKEELDEINEPTWLRVDEYYELKKPIALMKFGSRV